MPKTLPAVVAAAIIAFSVGFNVARYPIVWEMAGPQARLTGESGGADSATAPQPAKSDELIASIPGSNPDSALYAVGQIKAAVLSDQARAGKTEAVGAELPQQMTRLVPVPSELFKGNGRQDAEKDSLVRRLPPIYEAAPIPAGRYTAEYPQSPVTIYPSTGIE